MPINQKSQSSFAMPSFLEGMARILDLGNTMRHLPSERGSDSMLIQSDWVVTGEDLRVAMETYGQRIGQPSAR